MWYRSCYSSVETPIFHVADHDKNLYTADGGDDRLTAGWNPRVGDPRDLLLGMYSTSDPLCFPEPLSLHRHGKCKSVQGNDFSLSNVGFRGSKRLRPWTIVGVLSLWIQGGSVDGGCRVVGSRAPLSGLIPNGTRLLENSNRPILTRAGAGKRRTH